MTLKTLADVRTLIGHVPKEHRDQPTWQHVQRELKAAAAGGDNAAIALRMVLMLEGVEHRVPERFSKTEVAPFGGGEPRANKSK